MLLLLGCFKKFQHIKLQIIVCLNYTYNMPILIQQNYCETTVIRPKTLLTDSAF